MIEMNKRISPPRLLRLLSLCLCLCTLAANAQYKTTTEYDWDTKMKAMGLVDVCFWEPLIQSYLVYKTKDNFMGKPLYNSKLTKAWLHPRAAKMLILAQDLLKKEHPDLSLLIYDAARPMEVQREMGEWAKKTNNKYYVADPAKGGGLHNYGMSVDVTLVDENGEWLPMGTPFDFFGPEAHTDREDDLLKKRRISPSEYKNRKLLRRIMEKAGFKPIASEWWHFNACSREEAREKYPLIDR
jgi:D-alanyl-D-alanine dipeptidase